MSCLLTINNRTVLPAISWRVLENVVGIGLLRKTALKGLLQTGKSKMTVDSLVGIAASNIFYS